MKINLNREEIEEAVRSFLVSKSFYHSGNIDIELSRGGATITVTDKTEEPEDCDRPETPEQVLDTESPVSETYDTNSEDSNSIT